MNEFWNRRDKLKEKYAGRSSGMGSVLGWLGTALLVLFGGGAVAAALGMLVSPWIGVPLAVLIFCLYCYCVLRLFLTRF